jgi:hypothetical protein
MKIVFGVGNKNRDRRGTGMEFQSNGKWNGVFIWAGLRREAPALEDFWMQGLEVPD